VDNSNKIIRANVHKSMNRSKRKAVKPASKDPVKEAMGHPDGPSLKEMINGEEEKKLQSNKKSKKAPDNPDIPII
jgi:hypothetical protein